MPPLHPQYFQIPMTPIPDSSTRPKPPPQPHPKPLLRLEIRDLSSSGSKSFLSLLDCANILQEAVDGVLSHLYTAGSTIPPTRSITLILRSMGGVAYTTGSDIDDDHKEIHFSTDYIESIPQDRRKMEMLGVLRHEMVHCWQWAAKGTCPGGLIEGIADWVRLRCGFVPPHWRRECEGEWDAGYQHTGYFLEYLETRFGRGMVVKINERLRERRYEEDGFWVDCCGHPVKKLWKEYGRSVRGECGESEVKEEHGSKDEEQESKDEEQESKDEEQESEDDIANTTDVKSTTDGKATDSKPKSEPDPRHLALIKTVQELRALQAQPEHKRDHLRENVLLLLETKQLAALGRVLLDANGNPIWRYYPDGTVSAPYPLPEDITAPPLPNSLAVKLYTHTIKHYSSSFTATMKYTRRIDGRHPHANSLHYNSDSGPADVDPQRDILTTTNGKSSDGHETEGHPDEDQFEYAYYWIPYIRCNDCDVGKLYPFHMSEGWDGSWERHLREEGHVTRVDERVEREYKEEQASKVDEGGGSEKVD